MYLEWSWPTHILRHEEAIKMKTEVQQFSQGKQIKNEKKYF